jgi:hypothetical protein
VRFANGDVASGVIVTVTSLGGAPFRQRVTRSDTIGQFTIDSVPSGAYQLKMQAPRGDSAVVNPLPVRGMVRADVVLTPAPENTRTSRQWALTFACLLLYAAAMLFARWNHIARSVHAMLGQQITALETRLETEVDGRDKTRLASLRTAVKNLKEDFAKLRDRLPTFHEFFFWSRGRENSTWVVIHEIERQMASFLAPREQVEVYLQSAEVELRTLNSRVAAGVANAIAEERAVTRPSEKTDPQGAATRDRFRKALLGRASAIIYDERDKDFSTLMEWQNKAGWLIIAAVIIMGFLVLAAGHAVLLLAGAAGGFMSRLARALNRDELPLDYGASWTTLFLSPLLGALAGWFGIALIDLATSPSLNLLGSAFRLVDWDHPSHAPTLAVAFLLGFSERLFDAVVGAVDRHNEGEERARRVGPGAAADRPVVVKKDPPPPGGAGGGVQQPGGGGPPPASPTIAECVRSQRTDATGKTSEVIEIRGTGFLSGAVVTVNGDKHPATMASETSITIPLSDEDITVIEQAGEFDIVVTNPNGAASTPCEYKS